MRKQMFYIATAVYTIAAVVFFVLPPSVQNFWICVPAWLLTLFCALGGNKPCRIAALALATSAVGDVFGGMGALLPQIGSFAIAQIVYAVLFCRYVRFDVHRLPLLLLPLLIAIVVATTVLPRVEGFLRIAISGYMLVIMAMSCSAMFVRGKGWWLVAMGAVLFVISDSIIAWNLFVEPISAARLWIMSSYYAAQALLGLSILSGVLSDSKPLEPDNVSYTE